MDPDRFLASEDAVPQLFRILSRLYADRFDTPSARTMLLRNARVDGRFRAHLSGHIDPIAYTNILVGALGQIKISEREIHYHPLVCLLDYLLALYLADLSDAEAAFLGALLDAGRRNLKAIRVRAAVGRIEAPLGTAIGTGVLVGPKHLLTCYHVFTKQGLVRQSWVRFGYYNASEPLLPAIPLVIRYNTRDQLDLDSQDAMLDYALVRLDTPRPERALTPEHLSPRLLNKGWPISLIHHPNGGPATISEGAIAALAQENAVVYHTAHGDHGSSGGALLDADWRVVAIHRGNHGVQAEGPNGALAGVPLGKFWDRIHTQVRA